MFRKNQNINDICQEREQMLSQLRRSKRMNMMDEKRNKIILYNSFNELLTAHPDLKNSNFYSSDCIDLIKDKWYDSISCVFTLKNNHFLMSVVEEFKEITDVMLDFDNYKCMVIIACHKYIYIDNQFDLHNLIENSTNIFKWWDDKKLLLDQTYNEGIYYPCDEFNSHTSTKFYTNILEEAYNYIKQNYDDYYDPILLELDITDGCPNYDSIKNDNKKYEVVNEIDLINQSIMTLKNSIDLKQRKYVVALVEMEPEWINDPDCEYRDLRLIQIDNLEQLEYLKRYVDCDPYVYKTI